MQRLLLLPLIVMLSLSLPAQFAQLKIASGADPDSSVQLRLLDHFQNSGPFLTFSQPSSPQDPSFVFGATIFGEDVGLSIRNFGNPEFKTVALGLLTSIQSPFQLNPEIRFFTHTSFLPEFPTLPNAIELSPNPLLPPLTINAIDDDSILGISLRSLESSVYIGKVLSNQGSGSTSNVVHFAPDLSMHGMSLSNSHDSILNRAITQVKFGKLDAAGKDQVKMFIETPDSNGLGGRVMHSGVHGQVYEIVEDWWVDAANPLSGDTTSIGINPEAGSIMFDGHNSVYGFLQLTGETWNDIGFVDRSTNDSLTTRYYPKAGTIRHQANGMQYLATYGDDGPAFVTRIVSDNSNDTLSQTVNLADRSFGMKNVQCVWVDYAPLDDFHDLAYLKGQDTTRVRTNPSDQSMKLMNVKSFSQSISGPTETCNVSIIDPITGAFHLRYKRDTGLLTQILNPLLGHSTQEAKSLRSTLIFDDASRKIVHTHRDVNPMAPPGNGVAFDMNPAQNKVTIDGTEPGIDGNFEVTGDLHVGGNLSKAMGSFRIDHPLDPENKYLYHSFVESPDMMNIYNGNIKTDVDGFATVSLPAYFEALNMEFRYQLTPIGQFAQAIVYQRIKDNKFMIRTDKPNVEVSWQVTGIRNDQEAREKRIQVEVPKPGK